MLQLVYHKEWNCATVVEANLASNDNVMKNVMSLTTRVASIWSKVIPIPYLVKLMVCLHTDSLKRSLGLIYAIHNYQNKV